MVPDKKLELRPRSIILVRFPIDNGIDPNIKKKTKIAK